MLLLTKSNEHVSDCERKRERSKTPDVDAFDNFGMTAAQLTTCKKIAANAAKYERCS